MPVRLEPDEGHDFAQDKAWRRNVKDLEPKKSLELSYELTTK